MAAGGCQWQVAGTKGTQQRWLDLGGMENDVGGGPCEAKSLGRLWRGEGSLCVIGWADMCPVRF